MNRFSRDVDAVDLQLGMAISQTLGNAFAVLSTMIAITIATDGLFLTAVVPLSVVYYYVQRFFRRTTLVRVALPIAVRFTAGVM